MIKPTSHLLLALTFSATCLQSQTDSTFNRNTYQWEPNNLSPEVIDSIAFQVMLDAYNIWEKPELYDTIGFVNSKNDAGEFLVARDDNHAALVQIGLTEYGMQVIITYSQWAGEWHYSQNTDKGWNMYFKKYSSNKIPEIDEVVNPFILDIHTASLRSDLDWLEKNVPDGRPIVAMNIIEKCVKLENHIKSIPADTTYTDNEGQKVNIFYAHDLRFETNWSEDHLLLCLISDTARGMNSMWFETLNEGWYGQVWKQTNNFNPVGQWGRTDETWTFKISENKEITFDNDYPPYKEMISLPGTYQDLKLFMSELDNLDSLWFPNLETAQRQLFEFGSRMADTSFARKNGANIKVVVKRTEVNNSIISIFELPSRYPSIRTLVNL